ncbi:MAG: hypothetical protein O9353_13890 [Bacteroidia bacterium]|nr:hypothetical protein [Bacteroidia bacterium]
MSHFSDHQLKLLTTAEGKTLQKVMIYFWVNRLNPNAQIDLIDNVELVFSDDTAMVITCNDESTGINVLEDFNFEEEKATLKAEFGDKIKIIPIDASTTKMWTDVIGQTIESVELSKEDEQFLNDALILNFGTEKRSIGISPNDGLIIDYWED